MTTPKDEGPAAGTAGTFNNGHSEHQIFKSKAPKNQFPKYFGSLDFQGINRAALDHLPALVRSWAPEGRRQGHEWVALNPRRNDRHPGSFKINLRTGRWADFATGDRGGDVISLAAYIFGVRQSEAALALATKLGVRL
jgi:hypothetical protein